MDAARPGGLKATQHDCVKMDQHRSWVSSDNSQVREWGGIKGSTMKSLCSGRGKVGPSQVDALVGVGVQEERSKTGGEITVGDFRKELQAGSENGGGGGWGGTQPEGKSRRSLFMGFGERQTRSIKKAR